MGSVIVMKNQFQVFLIVRVAIVWFCKTKLLRKKCPNILFDEHFHTKVSIFFDKLSMKVTHWKWNHNESADESPNSNWEVHFDDISLQLKFTSGKILVNCSCKVQNSLLYPK